MKRVLTLAALALTVSGGTALAAEPGVVAQLVHSCCDLAAACCEACVECCKACVDCLGDCAGHCADHGCH